MHAAHGGAGDVCVLPFANNAAGSRGCPNTVPRGCEGGLTGPPPPSTTSLSSDLSHEDPSSLKNPPAGERIAGNQCRRTDGAESRPFPPLPSPPHRHRDNLYETFGSLFGIYCGHFGRADGRGISRASIGSILLLTRRGWCSCRNPWRDFYSGQASDFETKRQIVRGTNWPQDPTGMSRPCR